MNLPNLNKKALWLLVAFLAAWLVLVAVYGISALLWIGLAVAGGLFLVFYGFAWLRGSSPDA